MRLKLCEWRRARGISQGDMAKKLSISKPTYFRWEKDPQNISMHNAERIANILEVSLYDIIFLP